jgi:hypothetical protein
VGVLLLGFGVVLTACGRTATSTPAASALQPASVRRALCPASRFADGSVYAQITLAKTSCAVAASVASGSNAAKGAACNSAGFSCIAKNEYGSGSPWAAVWGYLLRILLRQRRPTGCRQLGHQVRLLDRVPQVAGLPPRHQPLPIRTRHLAELETSPATTCNSLDTSRSGGGRVRG